MNARFLLAGLPLLWVTSAPSVGLAASFDCSKLLTSVESKICSNLDLSKLDDELAQAYSSAKVRSRAPAQLAQDQRRWLAKRDACEDFFCIWNAYRARIAQLRASLPDAGASTVRSDDYVLDPEPTEPSGNKGEMPFDPPDDSKVCPLYLENLRFFARHNTPMSCERPIATHMRSAMAEVEWENLDPLTHPELFRSIVALASYGQVKPQSPFDGWVQRLKKGEIVFRRAKLSLQGYVDHGKHEPKSVPEAFNIVQYGTDVTNTQNPDELSRCKPRRGGPPDSGQSLKFYLVSDDLKQLYGRLFNLNNGNSGHYFRLIRGRPYVEQVLSNGNSVLMQLETAFPVGLRSVCMYLFQPASE